MTRWPLCLVIILTFGCLGGAPGWADDRSSCDSASGEPAIAACTRLIESRILKAGDLARAYAQRGDAYTAKRDYDRAIADVTEAIRLEPNNPVTFNKRGNAYYAKGDRDNAIADYTEALRIDPRSLTARFGRGNAYLGNGDYDRAIADYTEAIRLDPKYAMAFSNRGLAYSTKGDHDRAIVDTNEAVRLAPNSPVSFFGRGVAHHDKGELDRALADYDEAIRLSPQFAPAFRRRGVIYYDRGEHDRAIAEFNEAIALYPAFTSALTGRGLAYEARGNRERAKADFEAALAAPERFLTDRSAHDTARNRLAAIAAQTAAAIAPITSAASPAPGVKPTNGERRVALVIGNSAYSAVPELRNPRRDGQAFAEALRGVGFQTVVLENDLTREKFVSVLRSFAAEAETADWAVIYFAGHGIEVGGVNYLIPVDARLTADRDVQFEAVSLDQVLGAVEGGRKLRLVLLDACRENPFKMRRTAATRSVGRGLARIEPGAGTLVAYAAKDGQVALDGDAHSPFVAALIRQIGMPGLEINKLFRLVHDDVMEATGNRQEPYTYGALPGREDFFFLAR